MILAKPFVVRYYFLPVLPLLWEGGYSQMSRQIAIVLMEI